MRRHENPSYNILMGCRSISKGKAAASSFPNLAIEPIEFDISSDSSNSKAFATVQDKFDRVDILINDAGISKGALPEDLTTHQRYAQITDTNTISAACLTETFNSLLRKAPQPYIIFMTSELGSIGDTLNPVFQYYGFDALEYKASKAALNMIMATKAVKLQEEDFKVNVCCPRLNATGLNGDIGGHPSVSALYACRLVMAGKDGGNGTFKNQEPRGMIAMVKRPTR